MILRLSAEPFTKRIKQDKRKYLVEDLHRFVELYIPQERRQVLEEIDEQLRVHGPTLKDDDVECVKDFVPNVKRKVCLLGSVPFAGACAPASGR